MICPRDGCGGRVFNDGERYCLRCGWRERPLNPLPYSGQRPTKYVMREAKVKKRSLAKLP